MITKGSRFQPKNVMSLNAFFGLKLSVIEVCGQDTY